MVSIEIPSYAASNVRLGIEEVAKVVGTELWWIVDASDPAGPGGDLDAVVLDREGYMSPHGFVDVCHQLAFFLEAEVQDVEVWVLCCPADILMKVEYVWLGDANYVVVLAGFEDAVGASIRPLYVVVGYFDYGRLLGDWGS